MQEGMFHSSDSRRDLHLTFSCWQRWTYLIFLLPSHSCSWQRPQITAPSHSGWEQQGQEPRCQRLTTAHGIPLSKCAWKQCCSTHPETLKHSLWAESKLKGQIPSARDDKLIRLTTLIETQPLKHVPESYVAVTHTPNSSARQIRAA